MRYQMPGRDLVCRTDVQASPRRAKELIRASIRRGMIREKHELAEDRLVKSLAMSRNSIRAALRTLAEEGIVTRRTRLGTSVNHPILDISLGESLPFAAFTAEGQQLVKTQVLDDRVVTAPKYIAERLALETDQVQLIEYLICYGSNPVCVRSGYLPVTDPPRHYNATLASIASTFPVLFGKELGEYECAVEVSRADGVTSRLLEIEEGAPVLLQEVLLRDEFGTPSAFSYTAFRSDLVTLSVRFANACSRDRDKRDEACVSEHS